MSMTDAQIKHMVDRFLTWKLPEDFGPDCGISFQRSHSESGPYGAQRYAPVGTNLLTAVQAEAMVRHMLEGLPPTTARTPNEDLLLAMAKAGGARRGNNVPA